jgi:hypothetical protein
MICQANSVDNKIEIITLYNLKKAPASCACNLESLFENWSDEYITNASDLELVSYTYLGIIQDTIQINHYSELMTQLSSPFMSTAGRMEKSTYMDLKKETYIKINSYKQVIDNLPDDKKEIAQKEIETELYNIRLAIRMTLKEGFKIYSIKFKYLDQPMDSYIFCDPHTFEVVMDTLFNSITF